jgi:hypothetical protein
VAEGSADHPPLAGIGQAVAVIRSARSAIWLRLDAISLRFRSEVQLDEGRLRVDKSRTIDVSGTTGIGAELPFSR